jgi:hypothetical protein
MWALAIVKGQISTNVSSVSPLSPCKRSLSRGMQRFDVDGRACRFRLSFIAENARRPLNELIFPLLDLVGVHIELLHNSTSVCSPLMAASATFALKAGLWFRRGRLIMVSLVPGI